MTAETQSPEQLEATETAENGRRALLRKVAIGGAGAAVAAIALDRPASAADGDPIDIGDDNEGTLPTTLVIAPAAEIGDAAPSAFSVGAATADLATAPFPAQVGGYGGDDYANGLHGSTSNGAGFGVVAASLAAAAADDDTAAPAGLAVAALNGPQIKFVSLPGAVAGPTPGAHAAGELYVDAAGTLWFTVPEGEDGVRFVKLAGSATAGAFHSLPVAKRVYDSRTGTSPAKIAEGGTVDIDLTKDFEGNDSGFPAGSGTALVNITIADTEAVGFVSLFATGTPVADVKTSNINWSTPNTFIANSTSVAVNAAGSITALVGSDLGDTLTGRTHLIIDLVGYYL
jgi:hypothetical protein